MGKWKEAMSDDGRKNQSIGQNRRQQAHRDAGLLNRHPVKDFRPEYNSWNATRHRCRNPKMTGYSAYGGKGIDICDAWYDSFDAFMDDMGRKPAGKTFLSRHDRSKGYYKDNCYWATQSEVSIGTTRNYPRRLIMIEWDGRCRTISQWAEETKMPHERIRSRLKYGWPIGQVLGFEPRPMQPRNPNPTFYRKPNG